MNDLKNKTEQIPDEFKKIAKEFSEKGFVNMSQRYTLFIVGVSPKKDLNT